MKKSLFSVSTLVVLISMVALMACGSVANAQTNTSARKYIYDRKQNVEIVYTLDSSERYLTPKLKYEYSRNEQNGTAEKYAYRWNSTKGSWSPYYLMTLTEEGGNPVLEYALWNAESGDYTLNMQKAVYDTSHNNTPVAYQTYLWNAETGDWDIKDQVIMQNYLAIH